MMTAMKFQGVEGEIEYRESPDSAVSNSAVPDLVRFQNRTKLSKFPDIVRFFPEKLPIFVPKWSRFGQNIKVPV